LGRLTIYSLPASDPARVERAYAHSLVPDAFARCRPQRHYANCGSLLFMAAIVTGVVMVAAGTKRAQNGRIQPMDVMLAVCTLFLRTASSTDALLRRQPSAIAVLQRSQNVLLPMVARTFETWSRGAGFSRFPWLVGGEGESHWQPSDPASNLCRGFVNSKNGRTFVVTSWYLKFVNESIRFSPRSVGQKRKSYRVSPHIRHQSPEGYAIPSHTRSSILCCPRAVMALQQS
jgi:hypothetical protein